MNLQKSLLPSKVKLSGADCFHLALDTHAQFHNAGGNVVRMAFCLNQKISADELKSHLDGLAVIHWLCNIKLVSPPLSVPYWRYADKGNSIEVREHSVANAAEIPESLFSKDIGLDAKAFIEADLIHDKNKTTILLSWNHILMDGRGSGMLINYINNPSSDIPLSSFFPKETRSYGIFGALKNMLEVKKFLEESSKNKIASVASGKEKNAGAFRFKILRFSQDETKLIEQNARKNGTRFGVNSFLIAACARSVNKIIRSKGRSSDLWIPVPYDGRLRGAFGPVISNNVSSVFYTIPQEKLNTTAETVAHVTSQMNDQLKIDMPKKYNRLLDMMRYIPANIYYRMVSKPGEGALASFLFTATGEGIGDIKSFFSREVNDVIIYEPQTFPPGLTFLFLRFNNTLKVNISYSDAVISSMELAELESSLRNIFLANEP
jgi:NRPS condensation-like uncharacterized protein